jgi:hypothetical protein
VKRAITGVEDDHKDARSAIAHKQQTQQTRENKTVKNAHLHFRKGSVGRRTPHLDGDGRVKPRYRCLEGLKREILVWKDPELWEPAGRARAVAHAKTHSGREVVLIWAKPRVALCLLEDVVKKGVVAVVIHRGRAVGRVGTRVRAGARGVARQRPGSLSAAGRRRTRGYAMKRLQYGLCRRRGR